ncbi:putative phosphoribosyl transferase [Pseudomonas duriflava]|uniref:Putative phosphoribosyl transferase n=1 Tax=Pseudomonas duriflava TaxID=459528 RepID=A0A562QG16_9PSED|nr:phosphoribosyltransferase family protein [Pseudomonas duriflava]TWI54976.1 putative phosphoribosyl transferase [Pseudomonas duriflava]
MAGFRNRQEAGRALLEALRPHITGTPIILALPRGGVPVAYEIAHALAAPLDVVLVRKIGAPHNQEFGIGAIVDGNPPHWVADQSAFTYFKASTAWFEAEKERQLREIERRRRRYCGDRPPVSITDRQVIVVDDGVATGNTARVVLEALAKAQPARLLFAAPVGPRETLDTLRPLADKVVCLLMPEPFYAVGMHYDDFEQTSDEEVITLLAQARESHPSAGS